MVMTSSATRSTWECTGMQDLATIRTGVHNNLHSVLVLHSIHPQVHHHTYIFHFSVAFAARKVPEDCTHVPMGGALLATSVHCSCVAFKAPCAAVPHLLAMGAAYSEALVGNTVAPGAYTFSVCWTDGCSDGWAQQNNLTLFQIRCSNQVSSSVTYWAIDLVFGSRTKKKRCDLPRWVDNQSAKSVFKVGKR